MMIACFVLIVSLGLFLQFFIFYCRVQIAAGRRIELSDSVREVAGIGNRGFSPGDFPRLKRLADLCPGSEADAHRLDAIRIYHAFLGAFCSLLGKALPAAAEWADQERVGCAYFAAVALDARIARTRQLLDREIFARY